MRRPAIATLKLGTLLGALATGGCFCAEPLDLLPGEIQGEACDADSGEPLVGVRVRLEGTGSALDAVTDGNGRYRLLEVPAGDMVVVVGEGVAAEPRRFPVNVLPNEIARVEDEACREPPGTNGPGWPPEVGDPDGDWPDDPSEDPPADSPPSDDPPSDAPPSDNPPSDDPPADDPPSDPPPADDPPPVIEVELFFYGDCVTADCPASHPHPQGCSVFFTPGDDRGCVAHAPLSRTVYFQAGDQCNAGFVTGTLYCGMDPVNLSSGNCPINKPVQLHVDQSTQCPELHD